jgi:hypothetical protein
MTGRQRRKRKQLLDDVWETRGCLTFKEVALDGTVWRSRFGRSYGPVVGEADSVEELQLHSRKVGFTRAGH